MERKTITQVREQYQAAAIEMLPAFIQEYESDTRAGVRRLVQQAEKKLLELEKEKERIYRMGEYERQYENLAYVCGIDEAGRGPLAGPVAAAAVVLPKDRKSVV